MKKRRIHGLLVMALVLAALTVMVAGCKKDADEPDPFEGTWVGAGNNEGDELVASGGSFKLYFDGKEAVRGTYSGSGNTRTGKITEVNMYAMAGFGPDQWMPYVDDFKNFTPQEFEMTLDGDTLTVDRGVGPKETFNRKK
jgi:hypothetical protein